VARLTLPRLPVSPVEDSAPGRAFVWLGLVVAAASIALYGQDLVVPFIACVLAAAGHVVSHHRRHRPRGKMRQAVIAGLVFACLVYFILDSVAGIFGGQLPQAHFALLLVAATSFDLKTRRNLYSSLWISLTVLYLAAVYAWDYPFGVFVGLWMASLAGFWAASHLRRIEARPRVALVPVSIAAAVALLGGAGLFFFLPQPTAHPDSPLVVSLPSSVNFQGELESPALPLVQFAGDPSGASSSVDLRYRGRLGDQVVMYVRTGAPAYWRGLIFDHFTGTQWVATKSSYRTYPPYVDQHELPPPAGPQLGTFVQVVRVTRPLPGIVYAAPPIQAIYYPAAQLREDAYGTWRAPGMLQPKQTYSVVSSLPDYTPAALMVSSGADELASNYREFAALSLRAQALAQQAVAGADGTRYGTVMALTRYLQSHYQYSLQLGHVPSGTDPVDWFLFDARIGYCEQFATAETLMLRSLGIPARLATGYSTGTYDPVLDQAVVHESDAHAWVEVYFPGHGWVPVDPSPGFSALAATRFPDRFAASGLAHVIPHLALGAPGAAIAGLGLAGILPGVGTVVVAVVLGAAWLYRRRRPPGRRMAPEQIELLRLYEALQQKAGRHRAPPETPREYASRAPAGLAAITLEMTRAVERGAYRGAWPGQDELARLRDKLNRR
jgi:protein-glutamine gamma-glutamyltransferase